MNINATEVYDSFFGPSATAPAMNLNATAVHDSFFGTSAPAPAGSPCAAALKTRLGNGRNNQDCYSDTGYPFDHLEPAEVNDISFICKSEACKALVDLARSISPTECVADQEYYLYQDILNPIIRQCANLPTPKPSTNASATVGTGEAMLTANWTIPTTAPPPTTEYSYSPPSSWTSSGSSNDTTILWAIGLFGVFVLLAGCVSFFRQRETRDPEVQRDQHLVYGHEDDTTTPSAPTVYVKIDAQNDLPRKSNNHTSSVAKSTPQPSAPTQSTASYVSSRSSMSVDLSKLPLLQDTQIIAVRVPYEKITFGTLINSGGFGEVYKGTYKDEAVAIKTLLPEHRQDTRSLNKFLEEAKLMSSLEHEHIVRFVGVAWASASELCVLSELMTGGDLRSVLARYEAENRPEGVDRTKIKIALHVVHALTYMHSLQPMVLHRDLKSSNILLSQDMDAKITDFGVSRERADATMTRGVGTSLWMAPEIMMGGRYDEKADMFSFGVVLSELDSNKLPYASQVDLKNAKTNHLDIMQSVAQGRLTVDFSYESDPDIVALGRDCVSVDPHDRPSAAEALHRVHQVLRQYQQYTVV